MLWMLNVQSVFYTYNVATLYLCPNVLEIGASIRGTLKEDSSQLKLIFITHLSA